MSQRESRKNLVSERLVLSARKDHESLGIVLQRIPSVPSFYRPLREREFREFQEYKTRTYKAASSTRSFRRRIPKNELGID